MPPGQAAFWLPSLSLFGPLIHLSHHQQNRSAYYGPLAILEMPTLPGPESQERVETSMSSKVNLQVILFPCPHTSLSQRDVMCAHPCWRPVSWQRSRPSVSSLLPPRLAQHRSPHGESPLTPCAVMHPLRSVPLWNCFHEDSPRLLCLPDYPGLCPFQPLVGSWTIRLTVLGSSTH